MHELLGSVDRGLVHHLHAARNDAGGDDGGHAIARALVAGKPDQHRPRRRRLGQDPHGDLRHHAEQPLGAHHHAQEVVPLGVQMLAAKPDDLPIDGDQLHAEHIVGG